MIAEQSEMQLIPPTLGATFTLVRIHDLGDA